MIVGRPSDPVDGRSLGIQYAALIILVGSGLGFGLVLLLENFSSNIKTRDEVATLTNLPVVARLPRISRPG